MAGTLLVPSAACFLWFSTFGGAALHLGIFAGFPLAAAAGADPSTAIYRLFDALPLGIVLSVAATLLVLVFFITSADSATMVLSILCSGGNPSPARRMKLLWGALVAMAAAALLLSGGLKGIQTAAIVAALPFAVVIILLCVSLYRGVAGASRARELADRQLRRKLMRDAGP